MKSILLMTLLYLENELEIVYYAVLVCPILLLVIIILISAGNSRLKNLKEEIKKLKSKP